MQLEPAWQGVTDPIVKVFALLARYRHGLVESECFYACPIGSFTLELHEPDAPVRERLEKNFTACTDAISECLDEAGSQLPSALDLCAAAQFVLTTMEGGVMFARTYLEVAYLDGAFEQLRRYFEHLDRDAMADVEGASGTSIASGCCSSAARSPALFNDARDCKPSSAAGSGTIAVRSVTRPFIRAP